MGFAEHKRGGGGQEQAFLSPGHKLVYFWEVLFIRLERERASERERERERERGRSYLVKEKLP